MSVLEDLNLGDLAGSIGARTLETLVSDGAQWWVRIPEDAKAGVKSATLRLGTLAVLHLAGLDVSEEVNHAKAQILNWTFDGAELARQGVVDAFQRVLSGAGTLLGAALRKAILG